MEQGQSKSKFAVPDPGSSSKTDIGQALVRSVAEDWQDRQNPPPNDYDYTIIIMFNDGHVSLSDGGTFHDDKNISLWKENSTEKPRCTNSLEAPCYLLPCPFCGNMPSKGKRKRHGEVDECFWYTIECRNPDCIRCESAESTPDGAAEAWNRRGPREFTGVDTKNLFVAVERWIDVVTDDIEMSNFKWKEKVELRENLKSLSNKIRLWIGSR